MSQPKLLVPLSYELRLLALREDSNLRPRAGYRAILSAGIQVPRCWGRNMASRGTNEGGQLPIREHRLENEVTAPLHHLESLRLQGLPPMFRVPINFLCRGRR